MLTNYKTNLTEKKQLTSDVYIYRFKFIEPPSIVFAPGQYLIMMVPQEGKEKARRLYSIASPNTTTNEFELLVKLIPNGCASVYFEKLNLNDTVEFQGPAGVFTLRESPRNKIGLITGTGYAPLRSMLLSYPELAKNYTLFFGVPTYKDIFLLDELKQLEAKTPGFKFYFCLSREQNLEMIPEEDKKYFFLGHVTDGFEKTIEFQPELKKIESFDYYLCSGRDIIESLKEYLYQKGAPKEQVFFEKF